MTLYAAIVNPSEEAAADGVVFFILVFCVVMFHIGTIGGLVIYLNGRRESPERNMLTNMTEPRSVSEVADHSLL